MWRSIAIFAFAYVAFVSGRLHKTIAAVLGGCILIISGGVSQAAAYAQVDLNVVFLLLGMMILVDALAETGFFQWVAISLARATGGDPLKTLVSLVAIAAVLAALLDSVATVLMLAPVTVLIADQLELDAALFLILMVIGANVGGAATLVGSLPNLLIGSGADLTYNQFLGHLAPLALVCLGVLLVIIWWRYRGRLHVPQDVRARLRDAVPAEAITDRRQAVTVGVVLALVLAGFLLHGLLDVEPSVIALGGAMLMLLVSGRKVEEALAAVEWSTLMFFVGLFILVAGLDESGVLGDVAGAIFGMTRGRFLLAVLLVMWGSAAASAVMDNVPFVAAMIPVVQAVIPRVGMELGLEDPALVGQLVGQPLWWALALGACLGGSITLIGSSPNLVMVDVARRHGYRMRFGRFVRYGLPLSVVMLLISSAYLYVRYFLLSPL